MKQTLRDYDLLFNTTPIYCDNTSAINLSKNPVYHSRTKYIEARHHFLRDHVAKNDVKLEFIPTNDQLADIFTKPLDESQFVKIRRNLGICKSVKLNENKNKISRKRIKIGVPILFGIPNFPNSVNHFFPDYRFYENLSDFWSTDFVQFVEIS